MKIIKLFLVAALAMLSARYSMANIVGNYTPDANTLFLLHFDEAAGTSTETNFGTKGGLFYTATMNGGSHSASTVATTLLGQPSYVNGATNFGLSMTNPAGNGVCGYDFNKSGTYDIDTDALPMTNLNIGLGGQTPFTLEAIIQPSVISGNREIICSDSALSARAFQFRITSSTLQFQFINGGQAISGAIPSSGNDAFVAGNWYHVALTYDGTTATLYWTLLNPTNGAAHVLTSAALAIGTTQGNTTGSLGIGNNPRNNSSEQFLGNIDEVRISSVARGSGQMQFYSPLVSITANPISQNVDYNQPVNFTVGASSQFALGYQWRFNSNSIAGATNTSYYITNVAASNSGYYDCVVTNTAGYTATSSEGNMVVGAANFIADRYSFSTSAVDATTGFTITPDSIGGHNGTNFGDAVESGGQLVLDGTSGTYLQLPPGLFNSGNATALTVEFWATYGTNPNNVYPFAFGVTNYVVGSGIIGFNYAIYSSHNPNGQSALCTPGDPGVSVQTVSAPGNLDGQTAHVAVVFDAPDKILSIYTNGLLAAVNTNFTIPLSSVIDQESFIGRSLYAADPYLTANIDELRIFRGALSSITIKQSNDQGPNTLLADGPAKYTLEPAPTTVPTGQAATFTAATVGYLPITYQWFKNGTLIPGATNASVTFYTVAGDNGDSIFCQASNTIGVTTYVTNSTVVNLTVFTPPTLSWLGTADGGADNSWDTTSLNWTNDLTGGGIIAFSQTNGVLFDDRSGGGSVDLEQPIVPYNITVNAAAGYQFTSTGLLGMLNGQAGITKQNSGTLQIDVSNTLSGPVTISGGEVQVGNDDANGSLGSGPVTNNATLSFNRADAALNVGNPIHGSGTVSFDGGGSVTVTGNSDYSGTTLINSGVLNLQSATGLGATSAGTIVASGGQLYVTANVNLGEGLTLNGAGGDGNGALRKGGAGLTVETAPILLASDSTIGLDGGATLTLSNVVSGTAALTAIGSGTLTLNANNSFFGGFTLNGPVVGVNSAGALGFAPAIVSGTGRFVLGTGVTFATAVNAPSVAPGTATGLLMVNDNTNGTVTTISGPLTFGESPVNGGNFIGPTSSGYLNVSGPITASGLQVLVRLGNVRFSGGGDYAEFQDRANTTSLGANNGLSTNAVLDLAGNGDPTIPTYFDLNGFNQKLDGLKNTVTPANLGIVTNGSSSVNTLTLDLGVGNSYSFSGNVVGNVALAINSGTEDFTGTNTYVGNTTVNGGTLELATASIYSNSTVTVASGANLQLDFSTTNQVGALVLNGVAQTNGVYNVNNVSTYIVGAGSLLVVPPVLVNTAPTNILASVSNGNLVLTWPMDHTGWRLQVQTNSLSAGLNVNSNAWFTVPGSTSVDSVTNAINANNGCVFYRLVYP